MRASLVLALLLFALPAAAVTIEQPLPDAAQEQVARDSIAQLKCVVCEGQALADSDATFAREMRAEIRRRAAAGETKEEILTYFQQRYGTKILLTPPLEASTLPLWFLPPLLILLGGWLIWRVTRRAA